MSKTKPRLGRGLNSLLSPSFVSVSIADDTDTPVEPSATLSDTSGMAVCTLPLDQIVPNPHQPRKQFNETSLQELAESIRTNGLIQPILVRPTSSGSDSSTSYELIAGERRWRAAQKAGLAEIPTIIRNMDALTQAQLALIENVQREDLNPMDRASAYQFLMERLGLTQNELAGRLGEERSTIANFLRLLELSEPVRTMVGDGRLSASHAKLLAGLPEEEQQRLAELTLTQGLSVRNLERLVRDPSPATMTRTPPASTTTSAHLQELERSISRDLGLRAQIHSGTKGKGRLTLYYTSLDQFDALMERLSVKMDE